MTASDPRVGEIQARLAKKPGVQGMYSFHGADVAYLLAELADRDEKLAKVEGAMTAVHGEMDGGDLENYCSHDGDEYPCETVTALRAAVSAAKGGGDRG